MGINKDIKDKLSKIKLSKIMVTRIVKIREDEDLSLAQIKFSNHSVTHLPVVDSDNQVVGLLSRKYLYKTQSPRKIISEEQKYNPDIILDGDSFFIKDTLDSYILRHVMMKNPLLMKEDSSVADALIQMAKKNVGCLCIVNKSNKLTGILTDRDIVKFLGKILSN